jgi:hypothetical protein
MTKITPFWMRNAFLALLVFGVTLPFFQSLVSGTAIPIQKRNERVPDDATKWAIVLDWMEENNIQEEKMVFFSRGDDNKGLNDAKAFVDKNTDYTYFWKIFDSKFVQDFGEPDITNSDVAKACSIAMASHSSGEARVFNHNNGTSSQTNILYISLTK